MSESDIQRSVFAHLHWRGAAGVFAFHLPNGGKRDRIEAAIFKGLGARAGGPDVFAVHQGRCYAIELKTEAGRLTQVQRNAIADLERAGALTAVCHGLDAALHTLEQWGLLRAGRWWAEAGNGHSRG
ncbi:MAG TPA: VRR-NUC domain-containing protein [Xanthobacteraceae bacterium]